MFGDVSAWMFKHIGGLQPDPAAPGFKHFTVRPQFFPDLDWAAAEHHCPYGPIRSAWCRTNNRLELDLTIPVNTAATICLPAPQDQIREGNQPLSEAQGIDLAQTQENLTTLRAASGTYHFTLSQ
jgi:alpha-L-rhamnosidase